MPEPEPEAPEGRRLRLLDLAALVAGYGLAALLARACWPAWRTPTLAVWIALGLEYTWLGLAMSGPIVLLFDRRAASPRGAGGDADGLARLTRAERAWLALGAYLIVMTLLIVPARLLGNFLPIGGLLQALVAVALLRYGPAHRAEAPGPTWTHRTAVGVLATWPLAWATLILLSLT